MRDLGRSILNYIEARRGEMVGYLTELVRAESPTDDPAAQRAVFDLIAYALEGSGMTVQLLPGIVSGGQLLGRPEGRVRGRPIQLILGHSDTVWPHGTLAAMPVEAREGRLYGPGVFDMKAGITQAVFALEAIRALGLEPQVDPVVFINSDEEVGSPESRRQIRRLARIASRAFVLEPALGPHGALKTARKGGGRFTITVRGRSAHAGLDPTAGASAIVELSHVIQALHALNDYERGISVNVGTIQGGERANVVAAISRAVVDVRVVTKEDAIEVQERIRALEPMTPGVELVIDGAIGRPPLERTPRNAALWRLAHEAAAWIDLELEEALAGGTSDGNDVSQLCATLDGLGAVGDGAHAEHEHVELDTMPERAALLALLILAPPLPTTSPSTHSLTEPAGEAAHS